VKQSVTQLQCGWLRDIEDCVEVTGRHSTSTSVGTTERAEGAISHALTEDSICERLNTVHPTEFAMRKVAGNRLIPLLVIPRWSSSPSAKRTPVAELPTATGPHPDWLH
jgi:hypothetical protein